MIDESRIRYYTDEAESFGWYRFYPAPDPESEDVKGNRIRIRYRKNRPWDYEFVSDYSDWQD